MLKIDMNLSYEARWYDFETGETIDEPAPDRVCLKIKPHPFSKSNVIIRNGAIVISGEENCRMFKEALEDMANVVGLDGKPVPCTDEVKQKIYDFRMGGIPDFVIKKIWTFNDIKIAQEKNS